MLKSRSCALRWSHAVSLACDLRRWSLLCIHGSHLSQVRAGILHPGSFRLLLGLDELDELFVGEVVAVDLQEVALDLRQILRAELGTDDPASVLLSLFVLLVLCRPATKISTVGHVRDSNQNPEEEERENTFPDLDHVGAGDQKNHEKPQVGEDGEARRDNEHGNLFDLAHLPGWDSTNANGNDAK